MLIALFVIATAINLFKPFHIDDSYHLKAAQWILEEPLRPMSGTINWSGYLQPFHQGNQPPLFFYLMALWGLVFGFSEVSMHLLLAVFTALSIQYFHRLARSITPASAVYLTALLVLGPAFLVNQNVMLEIPLMAMICAMLFHLIQFIKTARSKEVVLAAFWLSAGILTKYTMLALGPVLLFGIWLGGIRCLWVIAIPITTVIAWSVWNWFEFGGIHLLGRDLGTAYSGAIRIRSLSWLMTLGCIAPWLGLAFLSSRNRPKFNLIIWITLVSIGIFIVLVWVGTIDQAISDRSLSVLFPLNGAAGILVLIFQRGELFHSERNDRRIRLLLLLSITCLGIFTILFAPWMATRHLLLVLPMCLILLSPIFERMQRSVRIATLVVTAFLGAALAISDHRFARFYKEAAIAIAEDHGPNGAFFLGSLGWGWYAESAGMKDLATAPGTPIAGDLIALPLDFSVGTVPAGLVTEEMEIIQQQLGPFDRFSTRTWLRFYSASFPDTPWNITRAQPERILLLKVL